MCALRFLVLTIALVIITSSQPTEFSDGQCPQSGIAIHEMLEDNKDLRRDVEEIKMIVSEIRKILRDNHHEKNCSTICPSEFLHRSVELKSCYFISKTKRNWANARDDCIRRGSYLVEVQSKEEDDFLKGILMTEGEVTHWMGGNDLLKEGQWVWQQSGKPFIYTNWNPGQPTNLNGEEHCLQYMNEIKWNDAPCHNQYVYICEISHT